MSDIESDLGGLLGDAANDRGFYPHTLFSVGVNTHPFSDLGYIVLVHASMGEHRFEFRSTPENARKIAKAYLDAADNAERLNSGSSEN